VKASYRVALACAALPLVTGTSVFLLWLLTRSDVLVAAGLFTLFGGLALFAVGVLALARFCWLGLRMPEPPPRFWASTALAAVLLLSNFPAAGLILWKVADLESRYTVVVRNGTASTLEGLHVAGGGHAYAAFGPIPPGVSASRAFRIRHEGELDLHTDRGASRIDGYVTANDSATAFVTVGPDGEVSVEFARGD
jgi:hypothetical protein